MGYLDSIPVEATEDLSSSVEGVGGQYKAINIDGTFAQAGDLPIGIQQGKAQNGDDATAGYNGRSRFVAGAATIAAGARLTVANSGYMVTAGSGDDFVGRNLAAVASGGISEGIFNFAAGQA